MSILSHSDFHPRIYDQLPVSSQSGSWLLTVVIVPMTGSLPPVPQAYVQICAMRAATFHPSTKAFVTPCTAEFEPEAVKAFQAELPVPLLMAGYVFVYPERKYSLTGESHPLPRLQFPERVWRGGKPTRSTEGDDVP